MKPILLILGVVLLNGCKNEREQLYDKYRPTWQKYIDSSTYYSDKFRCCVSQNNWESANIYLSEESRCTDSIKKYYDLMYPKGNPASEPERIPPPCDCK